MSKFTITEEKLTSLIEESVYELLKEAETDERLGHLLGNAFQSLKNKWNRFKGDVNAGRNYARWRDKDSDSYDKYWYDADDIRNFGGREYADYRYNQAIDRNKNSRNDWENEYGTVTTSRYNRPNYRTTQAGPTTNPNLNQQTTQTQDTTQPQNQGDTTQNQVQQNNKRKNNVSPAQKDANRANALNQLKQQRNKEALFLQQKGFTKRNGQWIYAKDGSNSPAAESQYPDIRSANSRYNYYNNKMNMMERKLKQNNIINEAVDKVLKQYAKKKIK